MRTEADVEGTESESAEVLPQDYRAPIKRLPRGFSAERHEHRLQLAKERQEREFYEFIQTAPLAEGLCYFIGCDEGLVKIGYSRNVGRRFAQLRGTSGPFKLKLLATCRGGRSAEMHYHRKFHEHAVGGEWFKRCPEIQSEIARLGGVA